MKLFKLLILCFLLSGCMTLKQDYPDVQFYTLDIQRAPETTQETVRYRLKVEKLAANPPYNRKNLIYRVEDLTYDVDYYNRWDKELSYLMTDGCMRWFSSSPKIKEVIHPKSHQDYDYILSGRIKHIHGDFRDPQRLAAVVQIDFTLKADIVYSNVIFSKTYKAQIPIAKKNITDLLQGYHTGIQEILSEVEQDLPQYKL